MQMIIRIFLAVLLVCRYSGCECLEAGGSNDRDSVRALISVFCGVERERLSQILDLRGVVRLEEAVVFLDGGSSRAVFIGSEGGRVEFTLGPKMAGRELTELRSFTFKSASPVVQAYGPKLQRVLSLAICRSHIDLQEEVFDQVKWMNLKPNEHLRASIHQLGYLKTLSRYLEDELTSSPRRR